MTVYSKESSRSSSGCSYIHTKGCPDIPPPEASSIININLPILLNFRILKNGLFRLLVLLFTIIICLFLEWIFHVPRGITFVHHHLFYFPIVLSALFYDVKGGLYCSIFLALVHNLFGLAGFQPEQALRGIFMVIAGTTLGYIRQKMTRLTRTMEHSQQLFENIVENTGLSSLVVEIGTGKLLFANSCFCSKMELKKEDVVGKSYWFDFVHPEDREECEKVRERIIRGCPGLIRFECRALKTNGSIMELLGNVASLKLENAVMISFLDLTERNRLTREDKVNRIMFETLFNNTPGALVVIDKESKILNVNEFFLRTFHIPGREKVLGKDLSSILLKEEDIDLQKDFEEIASLCSHGQISERETYRRRYDGKLIPVHIKEVPVQLGEETVFYNLYHDISERVDRENELQNACEQLSHSVEKLILLASRIVEHKDPYTAGHERRVAELAVAIAVEMVIDQNQIQGIFFGGLLHDLGKIQIPSEILSKPGRLSDIEFNLIRQHPEIGTQILEGTIFPWPIQDMVRHHHERLDGSGYPDGLKGEAVSVEARILAVADVVEAMMNHRPYRAALGLDIALEEIKKGAGTIYDPEIVETCIRLFRENKFTFSK